MITAILRSVTLTVWAVLFVGMAAAVEIEETQAGTGQKAGEQINWQVISAGATDASSANYALKGTTGQTTVGSGSSENYGLNHGFWQEFGCCIIRGDVDHSGVLPVDIADLVYLVDYMFNQGPKPECFEEGDVDGSGAAPIDIADLVYLVDYMFNEGPAPPPCP